MNIVLKYILTNLKERKLRTAVMLLSIPLSSMLLFVSFSIGESYESAQQKMARGMAGSATLAVSSADGTGLVPADAIPALPSGQVQGFWRHPPFIRKMVIMKPLIW